MNKALLDQILAFRKKRNWKQFHLPKNLAISLNLEASEVLQLFQWSKDNQLPKENLENLKRELADVYYWLLLISHEFNIDIDKALENKMIENEIKYPVNLSRGNSNKYNKLK